MRNTAIVAACRVVVLIVAGLAAGTVVARAADLPLLVHEDFEAGAARWRPADPASWKIVETPRGNVYSLFQQSKYQPPHRSPRNIALLDDVVVGDFVLELRLQSTVKDYNHRSMVIVFGYQDPAHFYYVHFSNKSDNVHNSILKVDGKPRAPIKNERNPIARLTTEGFHLLKVERDPQAGAIRAYVDDMDTPILTATDGTFGEGLVGVGSFDDAAYFDDVRLYVPK